MSFSFRIYPWDLNLSASFFLWNFKQPQFNKRSPLAPSHPDTHIFCRALILLQSHNTNNYKAPHCAAQCHTTSIADIILNMSSGFCDDLFCCLGEYLDRCNKLNMRHSKEKLCTQRGDKGTNVIKNILLSAG